MKPDNKAGGPWLYALGLVPVIWFALLIAPAISGGLSEIVSALPAAMNNPFKIVWCEDSVKTVLIFIAAYGLGIGIYLSSRRNYRRGEEHGSAKWGDPRAVNKKYRDKDPFKNRIFTQHVRMGLDGRKHRRNLNTLVVGGSGAGKSRFYAKVNICQCNTSLFILDCKGELLRDCGGLLEQMGYEIKVVDLLNMEKSHCYNPFAYLKSDNDVQKMVTNLFKATTPKGSQSNDPFWDTAASMLLMALVFYLWYEAPEDEKNFPMIMEMLRAGEVREDDDSYQSPLDELFDRLEMRSPDHIAVKYYKDYRSGSAKTLKSIQITLASRLEKFNLSSVAALTATDELDLSSLGEKKVALFALIPDNDASFNFLVSLLYASTFQELFYSADRVHGGSLPVPVHFLMDEFANVSLPDDFDKLLATMRSRNISVSIIIQNIAHVCPAAACFYGYENSVDADKKRIWIRGQFVEVTDEVYRAYMQGDRKMRYFENDLKTERFVLGKEGQVVQIIPSREDSLDRLVDENARQFSDEQESVESVVLHKLEVDRLHTALSLLTPEERALIQALFFDERKESELAVELGISQPAVYKRKMKILKKLKIFLEK